MSSGFVSGGTSENPMERDDEWLKAQQAIEANRRRKEEESRQQGGKSLYEVLQSNKGDYRAFLLQYYHQKLIASDPAAKEEAFQESIKLKNQFRNLDEDEVEFLDAVLESTRAKEQAVKKETSEQLDLFRRQQEEAEKAALDQAGSTSNAAASPTDPTIETQWALNAKKRKRAKEDKGLKGVKIRKSSSTAEDLPAKPDKTAATYQQSSATGIKSPVVARAGEAPQSNPGITSPGEELDSKAALPSVSKDSNAAKAAALPGLGLADYSSDDD